MSIVLLLAPLSLGLAALFVVLFMRSVRSGQFQDLETPAYRALIDTPSDKTQENLRVENRTFP